jgi:hypothetical protein
MISYISPRIALRFVLAVALIAQQPAGDRRFPSETPEDVRLPNGNMQRQEILKADYTKTLEDARALAKLADELKTDLEKNDYNVLSVATLKKTDEIDRLAKRIHDRLKRY